VSNIYLIRHGQAGVRDHYDSLSDLGRNQSRLLGEYFASQAVKFTTAYSGELLRQRQTAEGVGDAYGSGFPEITTDGGWNEFDLDRMYREIAPRICKVDADFRNDYEAMRQQLQDSKGGHEAVHRRWLPCDTALVNAWIAGQHEYTGETWAQFVARVRDCQLMIDHTQPDGNIAVFSSAVPIAIWTGLALSILDVRVMKLAGVLHNASITVLQQRNSLRLFSFNSTPHLASRELRTFR
jgi:broad specificity phosphatase PhoE